MWIQTGDKEPILVLVFDEMNDPLTDKTDIKLKVRRRSDGKYLDWDDNTFKFPASVIELLSPLEEISKTYSPGEYWLNRTGHERGFDTSSLIDPNPNDVYFFTAVQDGGDDAWNLPQTGQIRVGGALDEVNDKTPVIF